MVLEQLTGDYLVISIRKDFYLLNLRSISKSVLHTSTTSNQTFMIGDLDLLPSIQVQNSHIISSVVFQNGLSLVCSARNPTTGEVKVFVTRLYQRPIWKPKEPLNFILTDLIIPAAVKPPLSAFDTVTQYWSRYLNQMFIGNPLSSSDNTSHILSCLCLKWHEQNDYFEQVAHSQFDVLGAATLPGPYRQQRCTRQQKECVWLEIRRRVFCLGLFGTNPQLVYMTCFSQNKFITVGTNTLPGSPGLMALNQTQSVEVFVSCKARNSSKGVILITRTDTKSQGRNRYRISDLHLKF